MKRFLALLLAAGMGLTLAACGQTESEKAASDLNQALEELASAMANSEDMGEAYDKYNDTLDEYITTNTPQVFEGTVAEYVDMVKKSQDFAQQVEMLSSQMKVDLVARGNSIVYLYTYVTPTDEEALKENLKDAVQSSMESVFRAAKTEVPALESIVVEYYNMAGELITTQTYN